MLECKAEIDPLLSGSHFSAPPRPLERGALHAGAQWIGVQRSGRNSYTVKVDIISVDLRAGTLCGTLQINHLTPELETLITFFEGEIIGEKFGFLTSRWGATEVDDMKHWSRFAPFTKNLRSTLTKPNLTFKNFEKPFLFMRWKEKFVEPTSQAQNIHGASYCGFYYIALEFEPEEICDQVKIPLLPLCPSLYRQVPPAPRHTVNRRDMSQTVLHESRLTASRPESAESNASQQIGANLANENHTRNLIGLLGVEAMGTNAERPDRVRRTSSSNLSYAAAVRGAALPTPEMESVQQNFTLTESATPKEVEAENVAINADDSMFVSSPTAPIQIATPAGTSIEEFPVPSSPPANSSARFGNNPARLHSSPSSLPTTLPAHSTQSNTRSATVHANPTRRASLSQIGKTGQIGKGEAAAQSFGLQSWTRAKMTGYYFFRGSEPYQELQLKYVPKNRGATQSFVFR